MNAQLINPPLVVRAGFNAGNALAMARLAADAYASQPVVYDRQTDTAVVVTESSTDLIIAFPGTRDISDLIKDVQAWHNPVRFGAVQVGVHYGFWYAWLGVKEKVLAIAMAPSAATKLIWITGHSKGGALAVICAAELRKRDIPLAGVYTFGEPRSGDKAWADFCDSQFGPIHFRLVDCSDVITHLPGLFAGNRHSGECEFILSAGGIMENPVLIAKIISDAWEVWLAKQRGPLALLALADDHHIGKYVERLSR